MPHPYLEIPEFRQWQSGGSLIRIPTQQDVPFTPRVRALVDTPEFQRLRHISQLGFASWVYPGATHTRFEHALGVFHNALRFLWQLGRDERFASLITPHRAEVLLVAALLHDVGHWPFCHPIEDLDLPDLPSHESLAARFLSGDGELTAVLQQDWQIAPEEILEILVPNADTPHLRLMRSILSGPIDIDKMDYLERDSLHAGVPYGSNFDRNRLIPSLCLNHQGDGLALTAKGRTAAELMVFARYVMFSEVYWHHAVRSATCIFARSFYELHTKLDLPTLFQQRESQVIQILQTSAEGTPVADLLDNLFGLRRRLHKRVAEFTQSQEPVVYQAIAGRPYPELVAMTSRLIEMLAQWLGRPLQPFELLIDAPPAQKEVEIRIDLYDQKSGESRSLEDVSPVVKTLAATQFDDIVKRVRIFTTADLAADLRKRPEFRDWLQDQLLSLTA